MKTEQILNLDYREKESQEIIQKVLRKIKPLSKCSDEIIPLEKIEKVVHVLASKYEIAPQWMTIMWEDGLTNTYSIGVKTTTEEHKWLGNVYGSCLYEVFAKLAIKMYSEVKSGRVQEAKLTKEAKQRERIAKKVESEEE